jgi:hypothetical protein
MKNNRLFCILSSVLFAWVLMSGSAANVAAQRPVTGTAKTVNKTIPVPQNWDYIYDQKKGYGFYVPTSSTAQSIKESGVDVMVINTGAPTDIDIFVLAFKDKTLTKDDLLAAATAFLKELGQTVTPGKLQAESDNYAVADATTVLEDGTKGKLRILVGTDITDNYIVILGASPQNFAANEKTIDTIWGSFEMWSGVH